MTTEAGKRLLHLLHELQPGSSYSKLIAAIEAEAVARANAEADAILDEPGVEAAMLAYFDEKRAADRAAAVAVERAAIRAAVVVWRKRNVRLPEEGADSLDAAAATLADELLAIIDGREP